MYTLEQLKAIDISTLTITDKVTLSTSGRPLPEFILEKSLRPTRFLQASTLYFKYDWICGCIDTKSFYCFPCVLFSGLTGRIRSDAPFIKVGINDVTNIHAKINQHEYSEVHILSLLESQSILNKCPSISFAIKQEEKKIKHDNKICENRVTLLRIVSCLKLCTFSNLSIQPETNNEKKKQKVKPVTDSEKKQKVPVYNGIIKFISEFDYNLKRLLNNENPCVDVVSPCMINEILLSMSKVTREEILSQIKKTEFVSIHISQLDGVVTNLPYKLAMIVRYIHQSIVYERFWSFLNPSEWTAQSIAECILEELDSLSIKKTPEKLISQSYDGCDNSYAEDGSNIMFRVQNIVKEVYRYAMYIFSYVNSINSFLKRIAYLNCETKIFFINVINLKTFFIEVIFEDQFLKYFLAQRLPRLKLENVKNGELIIFYSFRIKIIKSFEDMRKKMIHNDQLVFQLDGFIRLLRDKDFIFWLNKFYKISQHMRTLLADVYLRRKNEIYHLSEFTKKINEDVELLDPRRIIVNRVNVEKSGMKKKVENGVENGDSDSDVLVIDTDENLRKKRKLKCKTYSDVEELDDDFEEGVVVVGKEKVEHTVEDGSIVSNIVLPLEEVIIDMEESDYEDERTTIDDGNDDYDRLVIDDHKDPLEEYPVDVKEEGITSKITHVSKEVGRLGFLVNVKREEDITGGSSRNVERSDETIRELSECQEGEDIEQLRSEKTSIECNGGIEQGEIVIRKRRRIVRKVDGDNRASGSNKDKKPQDDDSTVISVDTDEEDDEVVQENSEETKKILEKIIKCVIVQVKESLTHTEYLDAMDLLNYNYFHAYVKQFPHIIFNNVSLAFARFINKKKLKSELEVLYQREEFKLQIKNANLLCFIEYSKFNFIMPETTKLLRLVLTIPGVTYEKNVCYNTIDEIHTFLKECPTAPKNRLQWLAVVHLNSLLIERVNNFDQLVVEEFSQLPSRQKDFSFTEISN